MKYFLATVFLILSVLSANAAIAYDVNHTIVDDKSNSVGTITGFINTDGTVDKPLADNNMLNWSLSLSTPDINDGNPSIITLPPGDKMTLRGSAVTATTSALWFDFATEEKNSFLLFSRNRNVDGRNKTAFCCPDTLNGYTGTDCSESAGIVNGTVLSEGHPGKITFATAVPAPEAVWLFGSGLLVLAGLTRRKR